MKNELTPSNDFETEVAGRFGILPNFFRSAQAAPELIQQLWGFAKAGYLDNPMPSVFKERLFVWLSRFCPMRYCIVRHVGFLLGRDHGRSAGDAAATPQTVADVVRLLRRPTPWQRDMTPVYARLENLAEPIENWPDSGDELEDCIFACAAVMFVEPARSERARHALRRAIGPLRFELFSGCLAFIRTAHYWTMLHPEIETEDDMQSLLRGQEELARLLLGDAESDRCEMGERLFDELTALRDLNERQELEKAKQALQEKDRQKDHFIAALAHELRNPLATIRASAIKFTPAGGTVHLSFVKEGTLASISVRDTGVGFGEQFATRLFEPFTQEEQARDRPGGGLGLGLTIASRLAALQGGTLTAASAGLNQGATFTLRIPLAASGSGAVSGNFRR